MPLINIGIGSSVGTQNGEAIDDCPRSTNPREDQADFCPHCQNRFEIVRVKFGFGGATTIATCPNCAMVSAERSRTVESNDWNFWQGPASVMDGFNQRFKYIAAFLIGAVIIAAVLRHTVHVYGGLPREDIRTDALIAIVAVLLVIIFLRRKRPRERNLRLKQRRHRKAQRRPSGV
jgi:hypothetical protein